MTSTRPMGICLLLEGRRFLKIFQLKIHNQIQYGILVIALENAISKGEWLQNLVSRITFNSLFLSIYIVITKLL